MSILTPTGSDRNIVELALDRCVCYPMESVTLFVRASLEIPTRPLLCIHMPQNAEMEFVHMEGVDDFNLSVYTAEYDGKVLVIPLDKYLILGSSAEIQVGIRLHSIFMNHYISFCAWLDSEIPDGGGRFFNEPPESHSIDLKVNSQAEYMRFLPEVYSYDDFVNRFLMMFESFWKPINQQIGQFENYYDPDLTPESFLNWLACWVGMRIDETFPKDRIRMLIRNAIPFLHSRGTASSLKYFLELYSGGEVNVTERKAHNMVIGGMMGIGDGLALGMENKPNTVVVNMKVSDAELERTGFTKEKYIKKIKDFIRDIVPAHTVFSLTCNFEKNIARH